MNKWIKQHLTIATILTLFTGYGVGAAVAAVMKSDIEHLKEQVKTLPERLARVESRLDLIIQILQQKKEGL